MPANSPHETVTLEGDIHWVVGLATDLRLEATSCSGADGPWKGNLRATHPPVGRTDRRSTEPSRCSGPLGATVGPASPRQRAKNMLYGVAHTSQFTAYLTGAAGAIKVVDIIGIEEKGAPTSVGPLYSNVGWQPRSNPRAWSVAAPNRRMAFTTWAKGGVVDGCSYFALGQLRDNATDRQARADDATGRVSAQACACADTSPHGGPGRR